MRARQVADTLTVGREIRVNPPLAHTVLKQYNALRLKRASGEAVAGVAGSCREERRTEGTLQGRSTISALDFIDTIRSGGLAEWMTAVATTGRSQTLQTQSRPLDAIAANLDRPRKIWKTWSGSGKAFNSGEDQAVNH